MSKAGLLKNLKALYPWLGLSRDLKLSTNITFSLDADDVRANMQDDRAAIEAWMLLAKASRYGDGISYELDWTAPSSKSLDYERFMFRVGNFKKLFDWFVIAPTSPAITNYNIIGRYFVNKPNGPASLSPKGMEAKIEAAFEADKTNMLGNAVASVLPNPSFILGRQLPVGLFDGPVAGGKEVFNAKKSAIDLWGIDAAGLHVFELKAPNNSKIGAISELLFYAFFMNNVINGTFKYDPTPSATASTTPRVIAFNQLESALASNFFKDKKIHAHLLVPDGKLHPGLFVKKYKVMRLLNKAFKKKNIPIHIDVLTYELVASAPATGTIVTRASLRTPRFTQPLPHPPGT